VPTEHGPRWRTAEDGLPPSAACVSAPYDTQAHYTQAHYTQAHYTQAHYARKRSTTWVGYQVHLTETGDDAAPHLSTHVQTTPAPTADGVVTPLVHHALQQ
jgi:hypothetical protein